MSIFVQRPACDLCQSTDKQVLISKNFTDPTVNHFLTNYYNQRIPTEMLTVETYEVALCKNCGFIWQTNILNDAGRQQLYSVWIPDEETLAKKQKAGVADFVAFAQNIEKIPYFFHKKPGELTILDFGMGWGFWCSMAQAFGLKIYGLELSPERVTFARRKGIPAATNFATLPEQQFDYINAEQVFEHIAEPVPELKKLVNHLKPGGIIRLAVPNGKNIVTELQNPNWRASKNAIAPLEHINCFTHQTLIKLSAAAGLISFSLPLNLCFKCKLQSWPKNILQKIYKHFFGTALYFQKPKN